MSHSSTLLVTGASGHLGKRVLEVLLARGVPASSIIATTRDISKLKDFASRGVALRAVDFNDKAATVKGFAGADRLLLISTDTIGGRVAQHKNAIEAAKQAGVKHIIYTSFVNPDRSLALVGPEHVETEKLILDSGLSYTILRNNYYADNLLWTLPQTVKSGTLIGAQGLGRISYVTREDCARAAAAALSSDDASNSVLDITGPKAVSYEELAKIVTRITGKPIKVLDMPASDFKGALVAAGQPEAYANLFLSFDLAAKQGTMATVTSAVRDLAGSEPTTLENFLSAHKQAFIA